MAIVDDYKDIASRMKGELRPKAPEPEVTVRIALPKASWRDLVLKQQCTKCYGGGQDSYGQNCSWCCGTGVDP